MADTSNDPELLPEVAELAAGKNFAAVSTVFPSGLLQTQILWVGLRDGAIVVNTETHRARYRNISRDPRITVNIRDEQNPYRYAEVRGEVVDTITGPEARAHADELSVKYTGEKYSDDAIKSERVILVVRPHRQTVVDQ